MKSRAARSSIVLLTTLLSIALTGVGPAASAAGAARGTTPGTSPGAAPVTAPGETVASRPVVEAVAPQSGPLSPTTVVLTGKNLAGASGVLFGEVPGTVLRALSPTSLEVRTPASAVAGAVPVRVRTASGWTSSATTAPRYTFTAAPAVTTPRLTSLAPSSASYTGGQAVTLTGERLEGTTGVTFGTEAATVVSRSATQVVVTAPIGVLGATTVTVTTPAGVSAGLPFTYVTPPQESAQTLTPLEGTFEPAQVDWVTGGYDGDTGQSVPWVVSLPRGAAVPAVGKPFLVRPGTAAFPSGLVGTAESVAVQVDQSIRVTVVPTTLETSLQQLSIDHSGPLVSAGAGAGAAAETAVEWPIDGSALFCRGPDGLAVAFGANLTMRVTDVDVTQHLDLGGVFSGPTYDAALTAEVETTGKFHAEASSTCKMPTAWSNAHRRIFPIGTTGATVSLAPALEFTVSAKGTLTVLDRTRTTFAVSVDGDRAPRLSGTSRTVQSDLGGALTFDVGLFAGAEVQFAVLDRAGVVSKALLGATLGVQATDINVCINGKLVLKLSVGLFLDAWVVRWESPALTASYDLRQIVQRCVLAETSPPATGEPQITSARLPDALIGTRYSTRLQTADGRPGTWSVVRYALPAGLSLLSSGEVSGTPTGPVGDSSVIVDFRDSTGRYATTTLRLRVQPGTGIGGGDLQVTLRWSGPADLDLHVIDPAGERIYYAHPRSASGGSLDHDANAGCNGPADDDNAVENVFWPSGSAPAGDYRAFVDVWATCGGPLDWQLTVRRDGVVVLEQSGSGDSVDQLFSVGTGAGGTAGGAAAAAPAPARTFPPKP